MSDLDKRFHEHWLGLVQPVDGLVVSVPVLVDAQCAEKQPPEVQKQLLELCPPMSPKKPSSRPANGGSEAKKAKKKRPTLSGRDERRAIADLPAFLHELLGLTEAHFHTGTELPEALSLYVAEGHQLLRPTMALVRRPGTASAANDNALPADKTPASEAGEGYAMLVWDLPRDENGLPLPLDKNETLTGKWDYPPAQKFDRLLRNCRVPIGLLSNGAELRLMYAPHGESSGAITFRIDDMATVGGRPILDALIMLLGSTRWFAVAPEQQLPALLRESRTRQANVTTELAEQVFEALEVLLRGFESAAERDKSSLLREALEQGDDHLYAGLLTFMLRLVFLLYAEDRGLLPVEHALFEKHMSVLGLYDELLRDHGNYPDTMGQRFGAYDRLVALFRAVFLGAKHGELHMPARRGHLFDPNVYPFLEGWDGGSAPITLAENRAEVRTPSIDDGTLYQVLTRLLYFQGQRLSYRALDVEQIGSVYEALMGYHVVRVSSPAVCTKPSRVWVTIEEIESVAPAQRAKWLKEELGLTKAQAEKLNKELKAAKGGDLEAKLAVLEGYKQKGTQRAAAGRLVIQPGAERKRTSSHYTPRSLSAPIVQRTLDPLIRAMGSEPSSEKLLDLKVCDPAMGSGAFLVEVCRYLGDQVVAAWTRENELERIADAVDDVVNHARRLVAQRCLYGVDKNPFAVNLAKLSLWLLTQAKELPFTFLDHSLCHGDSLVGLSFAQIESFHWSPEGKQLPLFAQEIRAALDEALELRDTILWMADDTSEIGQRDKEILLADADDALARVKLVADVCLGAFFSETKDNAREKERKRRQGIVEKWLASGEAPSEELLQMQAEFRARIPAFHWMVEYPEVFHSGRKDPLDKDAVNEAAFMDAFVGNPPFMGGGQISGTFGNEYKDWLLTVHGGAHGNSDIVAHFYRRTDRLLGGHGTCGLIATNTVSQGDTRTSGLQWLLAHGSSIYDATQNMSWPGNAAVTVSVVHLAKGTPANDIAVRLDGTKVGAINSRLRAGSERTDAAKLPHNNRVSFKGSMIYGLGFTLTPEERDALIKSNKKNAQRIFPYLGGEEVNTSPTQDFHRYVISFGTMSLEEAEAWPDLIDIVREKVKPERDRLRDNTDGRRRKEYWWQYGRWTPALYQAIAPLSRCLVTAIHSKHLIFSFQPTDRIFSHGTIVFPLEAYSAFAVLQSRIHEGWAWLLSSTMRNAGIRYAASDCFETFPFPAAGHIPGSPKTKITALEAIGEKLYTARAHFMVETDQGLTKTYNALKDPTINDPRITHLRTLHTELDQAVLQTYGWQDLEAPEFTTPETPAEKAHHKHFEDTVIDRLFALNEERAKGQVEVASEPKVIKGVKQAAGRGRKGGKKAHVG